MILNIIFMGTPEFAVPILKSIIDSKHRVLEVYTQPPQKKKQRSENSEFPYSQLFKKIRYTS